VSHRGAANLDVAYYHSICAYSGMRANLNRAQNLCSSTNIDMATYFGHAISVAASKGHLMKYQAIHANLGVWMYDDSVWMRNQQTASNLTCQRDLCSGHDAPKPMAKNEQFAE
jgi:hypothetical protein